MALIACPECGGTVSDQAPSCIHCGFPLPSEDTPSTSFPKPNPVDPAEQTPSPKTRDVGSADDRKRITDEQLALMPDDPVSAVKRAHIVRVNHASRLQDEGRYTAEEYAQFDKASRAEMQRDLDELSAMGERKAPPEAQPATPIEERTRLDQTPWAWVTLAAGIGLIVGSLLPWATLTAPFVGTLNVTGTDGDGIITLIAGLVVGLVGILGVTRGVGIASLVALTIVLGLAAWVAVVDLGNVTDMVAEFGSEDFGTASVGIGLWLVTATTVVGVVGWIGLIINRPTHDLPYRP